ncbi:MAG: M23 family metallopeptidase [Candidatus Eremiobacteraeota bacterium]|nr:M23 family metallopeptidase [Candidatus Eremiobacteraeota bacterium]MBV8365453.1 M23 family metallopeptidase [Candidatus Eremiobacteraeota bacterium]
MMLAVIGLVVITVCLTALVASLPYFTFRLRPWLVAGSVVTFILFAWSVVAPRPVVPYIQAAALIVALALAFIPRTIVARAKRHTLDPAQTIALQAPFYGHWLVAAAGPDPLLNHHLAASDQAYACDFVSVEGSLGKPILAPCDAQVISVADGMPDRRPSPKADHPAVAGKPFGNHVVLKTGDAYVFLCHLMCGSIQVKAGDHVCAGDELARCGNSGRSTGPHLHVHAQRTPDAAPFTATGVPVSFVGADGRPHVPVTGDVIAGLPAGMSKMLDTAWSQGRERGNL